MPRISTDNYDTVASWNGSQDLFVVEQTDGTKVATPAMIKQFIQAGDFTATGEITDGHGNILKDMAKSADVATALAGKQNTLTFDNTPTQNSNNPVKSGGIYSRIGDNSGTLTQRIMLSASGNNSYTVTSDSAIMVAQFEGYLSAASDVFEANVQVNGLMIGLLGVREGVACNPTKREQIRIPFRVFKNDVIKITLSLTGSAVGYAALYTT